jgi:hypothetical protein
MYIFALFLTLLSSFHLVSCHASIWTPSMWGFNVTSSTFSYDNRPVTPLMNYPFAKWWFHGHLSYPPHPEDVFELPAGKSVTTQITCDKGATTYFASNPGGDIQEPNNPNDVCPGAPMTEYHTKGLSDVKGCALGIAYKSDVSEVQPADFTIFSVNQTCVWSRYTDFGVPEQMPPCPNNMCICAFFWIHSPDSGSEQNYMNGFQCRVTNSTSTVGLATSKVARRCGADPANKKPDAVPGNCTYGAKQPLYWFQAEQNNMFEGTYSPPFYNDLYNFRDGAQNDIFQNSYSSIPVPGPNQTALPVLATPGNTPPTYIPLSNGTAPNPTPSVPSNTTLPAPSSSPSNAKCKRKRGTTNPPSAHRGATRFGHKAAGVTRRSRSLNAVKKSEVWLPV